MSVNYRATLGYGLIVDSEDIEDPEGIGYYEVIENALKGYRLISFAIGGGGWSNSHEQWALFIHYTTQDLGEVDGVKRLERPKIVTEALKQLDEAYTAITGRNAIEQAPMWLVAGGWY